MYKEHSLSFISKLLKLLDPEFVLTCVVQAFFAQHEGVPSQKRCQCQERCCAHSWFPAGRDASLPARTELSCLVLGQLHWLADGHSSHPLHLPCLCSTLCLGWANWVNPGLYSGVWSDVGVLAAAAVFDVTIPTDLTTCWPLHPSFSPLSLSDQIHHFWWTISSLLIGFLASLSLIEQV